MYVVEELVMEPIHTEKQLSANSTNSYILLIDVYFRQCGYLLSWLPFHLRK